MVTAAVIYHAEAEWGGRYEPFEKAVKVLSQDQIDCDIVPVDTLINMEAVTIVYGKLIINKEEYRVVIVPYSEYLPEAFVEVLLRLAENSINVIFMNGYPENVYTCLPNISKLSDIAGGARRRLQEARFISVGSYEKLAEKVRNIGISDVQFSPQFDCLRCYHYGNDGRSLYLLTNESKYVSIETTSRLEGTVYAVMYDAMENRLYDTQYRHESGFTFINIHLEPYESIFIVVCKDDEYRSYYDGNKLFRRLYKTDAKQVKEIDGKWNVSICEAQEYPAFNQTESVRGLGNISIPGLMPEFSGTIRYQIDFNIDKPEAGRIILLDLGEAYETVQVVINGTEAGVKICPPYLVEITGMIIEGDNLLQVDVTNTLVRKYGDNIFDRSMPQEPSGLLGPVRLLIL